MGWRGRPLLFLFMLGLCLAAGPSSRLNDVSIKTVHNSYQRDVTVDQMLNDYVTRSFEFDIHISKPLNPSLNDDWYIYHGFPDYAVMPPSI